MFNSFSGLKAENFFELDARRGRGNSKKIKKQRFKLDIRKYFFSQRVINLWNQLTDDIVECESLDNFKGLLDDFMSNRGYV